MVNYNTGEQNKDMSKARQARDWKDTLAVVQYLQERNPFSNDTSLRNISTGVHANPTFNVATAHTVGSAILKSVEGKTSDEHTFRRKDQVVTLGTKSSIKIDGEEVQVDPQLLFQILIIVAQTSDELESAFKHELCSYPPALFDSSLLLREAHKPALVDAIWVLLGPAVQADVPNEDSRYVLDEVALIQRIPWIRGSTYGCIVNQYTEYVKHKHASGYADLLIVQKAVQSATSCNTVLVGGDTDLLVLLCYHASLESHDHLFYPEPKKNTKQPRIWNIKAVKQRLGPDMCQHILFLHAVVGCDTTSRLHGIGKGASLKKYQTNNSFREQAMVLHSRSASTHDVTRAGERALVIIYNGRSTDTLDSLRHQRFREKVASSATHVHPQTVMRDLCHGRQH